MLKIGPLGVVSCPHCFCSISPVIDMKRKRRLRVSVGYSSRLEEVGAESEGSVELVTVGWEMRSLGLKVTPPLTSGPTEVRPTQSVLTGSCWRSVD